MAQLLELNELSFYIDNFKGKDEFVNSELKQRVQMVSTCCKLKYFLDERSYRVLCHVSLKTEYNCFKMLPTSLKVYDPFEFLKLI